MPQSDHDLIVAHSVKIDSLCNLIKNYTKKLDHKCDRIHDGISNTHSEIFLKIDKKTNDTTFRWVAGILIVVMISLFSAVGVGILQINDNRQKIEFMKDFKR